jgi:peptidoglycan/xylan/chitin deacetylase (PgdA/CDA1 family)
LTFDDGPSPLSTDLIKLLKKHNKKAVFFLLGQKLPSYDLGIYEGFDLGCHGYRHVNFALMGPYKTYLEFNKAMDAFKDAGINPKYFRAPYGLYNLSLLFLIK